MAQDVAQRLLRDADQGNLELAVQLSELLGSVGTTLPAVSGRDPLIGVPITVRVLRADSEEVSVGLMVTSHALPHGRRVFTAELYLPADA